MLERAGSWAFRPRGCASVSCGAFGERISPGLRYRHRGWNRADPVDDALAALGELRRVHGAVPVVLVGHSTGGRAALRASAHPQVQGVLALAPWLPADEPNDHPRGRRIVLTHGDRDRVTSAPCVRRVRRARPGRRCVCRRGAGGRRGSRDGAPLRSLAPGVAEIVGDLAHRGGKRTGLGSFAWIWLDEGAPAAAAAGVRVVPWIARRRREPTRSVGDR
ncbi:hypothetical protein ACWGDX_17655, partial [Streptomyces sp. NPDC055025]